MKANICSDCVVDIGAYSYLLQLPICRYQQIPVVDDDPRSRSLLGDEHFQCETDCPSTLLRDYIAHMSCFQSRLR